MTSHMSHIGQALMPPQNPNSWARRQHNTPIPTPMLDQRADGLPPVAIDIVREKIARVFQDKLGVSMIPRGSRIENPMTTDLITTHIPREQGYPNFQIFWVTKERTHMGMQLT
jgi:hypothetical protein